MRNGGLYSSEIAGMRRDNYVGIILAENLRFLGEGSSAQGKPGAKARPRGVVDAHTVEIPWPPKNLSTGTHWDIRTRALVDPGERDRTSVGKSEMSGGEKSCVYVSGARTANRHR